MAGVPGAVLRSMPDDATPKSGLDDTAMGTRQSVGRGRWSVGFGLAIAGFWLLSFNVFRVGETYPVSDVFFVAATLAVLFNLMAGTTRRLASRSMRRTPPTVLLGNLLLLTGGIVSSLWSLNVFASTVRVLRLGWITFAWFWTLRALAPDRASLSRFIRALRASMVLAALIATSNYLGLTALGENRLIGRENAYFTHPNMLGGALAMSLPFFIAETLPRSERRSGSRQAMAFLQMGVVMAAIGMSGSMTSMTAAVVGAVSTIAVYVVAKRGPAPRRRRANPLKPMAVVVLVGAGLAALATSDLPIVDRFTALTSSDSSSVARSAASRPEQNQYVLDRLDSFIIIGVGHDEESADSEWENEITGSGAHNIFVKLLYEAGLIAVIGFLLIIIATGRQIWTLLVRCRDSDLYPLLVALAGSFIAANCVAQLNPVITERWYWVPTGLIGVAWAMRHRELPPSGATGREPSRRPTSSAGPERPLVG